MLITNTFSCIYKSTAIVFFCLLCLIATVAQDRPVRPDQQPRTEEQEGTLRINTELVSIDITVTDPTGRKNTPVLKAEDFVIYEDGARQQISNFATTEVPFNVVLLIDTSGSTREDLAIIRRAAARFLNELRSEDRVAVVAFNDQVELYAELISSRARLELALDRLEQGAGSAFYDAVHLSLDEILNKIPGRKAIVALTDGVDSTGYYQYEQLLPEVERAGTALYFLEWDTEAYTEAGLLRDCSDETHFKFSRKQMKKYFREAENPRLPFDSHCTIPPEERRRMNHFLYQAAHNEVRTLANQTGGQVYPVKNLNELEPVFARIATELRTQYSLAYYPTNDKRDGTWRKLRVEIKRKGWTARTRPGYRAPRD